MPDYSSPANFVDGITFSPNGLGEGSASSAAMKSGADVPAIADATATTVLTFTCPNVSAGASFLILLRSTITAVGHVGDSNRASLWVCTLSRVAGSVMVGTLSAALGATIATSGSSTLTSTLALQAVVGGATATNTIALQVTNTGTPAGISDTQVTVIGANALAGGVTVA